MSSRNHLINSQQHDHLSDSDNDNQDHSKLLHRASSLSTNSSLNTSQHINKAVVIKNSITDERLSSSSSSNSSGSSTSSSNTSSSNYDDGDVDRDREMDTHDENKALTSSPSTSSSSERKRIKRTKDEQSLDKKSKRRKSRRKSSKDDPSNNFDICTTTGLGNIVMRRTGLLVTLLLLQSLSQFILESYEHLISYHIVVPLFLTMLVGAGGNAGNQATVRVIAGLVTGRYSVADTWHVLKSEIAIGLVNGFILAGIGFTRVYWMYEEGSGLFWSAMAITLSLFCIVITSAVLGTLLPFFLEYLGVDREMAAPAIQVFMDICGVLITCVVSTMIIPESEHSTPHSHTSSGTTTEMPKTTSSSKVAFP